MQRAMALVALAAAACHAGATPTAVSAPARSPVPAPLDAASAPYGLAMDSSFTWRRISREETRFDWLGRPASGDYEVSTAAANLTNGQPGEPFEQSRDIAQLMGVDRIITVCFEPASFMSDGHLWGEAHAYRRGVAHGIVKNGALSIVVVLADDASGIVPVPSQIGARGR